MKRSINRMKFPWESKQKETEAPVNKQKKVGREKPTQIIQIEDKKYNFESLSDEIKTLIRNLNKADNLINLKKNKLQLLKAGQENIGQRLKESLKKLDKVSEEN